MKKIFFFLLFVLFPAFVSATVVDYDIETILIDAKVLENGNMNVKELIVLDGTFNGYIRDLVWKNNKLTYHTPIDYSNDAIYNASGIRDVVVKAKKITDSATFSTMEESFDSFTQVFSSATDRNYVTSFIPDGQSYKMYYRANDERVAFLLEYTVVDVVVLHKDVAEVYWTFIGSGFKDNIKNLEIHLSLPSTNEDMRVWAHGELTGMVDATEHQMVEAKIKKLPASSPIDIRVTFSRNIVSQDILKQSGEVALDSILQVEEQRAKEANEKREKARQRIFVVRISCGIYLVTLILYWIRVYFKYDKEYKPEFDLEYNREFIDDYNVEVVEYVMRKNIGPNAFSASILNLVYKKNIKVEELPKEEKKKKKNYQFALLTRENLNETENYLVDFLFERVGREGKFTTKELERYASSTKTYTNFQSSYTKWVNSAMKDARHQNFYEKKSASVGSAFLFLAIGILLVSFSLSFGTDLILPWICGILAVIFFFYGIFLKKKTRRGAEHYARWKAFKKFLEDFGTFDTRELPEIVLWERYLVYATVFGIADKVQKSMSVRIREMNLDNGTYSSYYPSWIDYQVATSINRSIHDSFQANQQTYSRELASSSSSSGSGLGGGFSSGGGFGGGGGGGRGF